MISNEEINDIMKEVKVLEEFGLSIKLLVKQFKMKQKNRKAAKEEAVRAGQDFLMPPYPFANFEIQSIIKMKLNLMVCLFKT